jgi:hypothetical protein
MKKIIICLLFVTMCLQGAHAFEKSITCDAEPTDMVVGYGTIVSCSVESSGDSDSYRFNGQSGDVLVIQATYGNGSTRPCIELIAPDNSRIEACDNSFRNRIDTVLDQTGTYSIIVNDRFGTGTGDYTVGVDRVLPVSEESQEIHFGEEMTGEISPVGELDLFNLNSSGNDNVMLTASYINGSSRPCVELIGPDNSRVEACANSFTNEIDTLLDQAGTYSIIVNDRFGTGTGEYTIALQCLSGDCVNIDDSSGDDDTDDSSGNDDADDGSSDDTDSGSGEAPAEFNATGEWTSTTSNQSFDQGNLEECNYTVKENLPITIDQAGNTATLTVQEDTFGGTVAGSIYKFQGSYADGGGIMTEYTMFTLSSETAGSGVVNWEWTDGSEQCSGSFNIDIAKNNVAGANNSDDDVGSGSGSGGGCFVNAISD